MFLLQNHIYSRFFFFCVFHLLRISSLKVIPFYLYLHFFFVANKAHQVTRNYVDDNPQFLLIIHFKGHGHVFDEKLFLRL